MQPVFTPATGPHEQAMVMEGAILEVRRHWFGAAETVHAGAVSVLEPGGELIMFVDCDGPRADDLIAEAAARGAYVVATDYSRPRDLGARLRQAGYRVLQRHGAYLYGGRPAPAPAQRRGWVGLLRLRESLAITVREIGPSELPAWNEVCWWSFGSRASLPASLQEKERAFHCMGARGRWYLAFAGDRPVGTACLFQGTRAAQVLAVGTLPAFRGRGVAQAVMHRVISDWEQCGSGVLFLDTMPGGRAERLYLRLGFRPTYLRDLYAPLRP